MIDARALLIGLLEAIEADPNLEERVQSLLGRPPAKMYYRRSSSPIELRAWDRMVGSGAVRVFKPGREIMVPAEDVHRWIESHVVAIRPDTGADDFESEHERFKQRIRRSNR